MPDDDDDPDFGYPDDDTDERFCGRCDMWLPIECFRYGGNICDDCLDDGRYGPR